MEKIINKNIQDYVTNFKSKINDKVQELDFNEKDKINKLLEFVFEHNRFVLKKRRFNEAEKGQNRYTLRS